MKKKVHNVTVRKAAGKTMREMEEEIPGITRALLWPSLPPPIPEAESPFDIGDPLASRPVPELLDLVLKWKVSVEDAETVYGGWILAKRQFRKLRLTELRNPSLEHEFIQALRYEFWENQEGRVSVRLRGLAHEIEELEDHGHEISLEQIKEIISEPPHIDERAFNKWVIDHWILPDGDMPPLCLCSDTVIVALAEEKPCFKGAASRYEGSIRQKIRESRLIRPTTGERIKKNWLETRQP